MSEYHDQFYISAIGPNTSDHVGENLVDLSESEGYCIRSFLIEKSFTFDILNIKKVRNSFLETFYELKKAENRSRFKKPPTELFLIHVTSINSVKNIVKNNFDWRRSTRGKFGLGTSFTDDAQYANRYANYNIGEYRALIICKVLVSRSTRGHKDQSQLAPLFDTSIGNNNKVYVKFCDNEMLPLFVVYYHCGSVLSSQPSSLRSNDQQTYDREPTSQSYNSYQHPPQNTMEQRLILPDDDVEEDNWSCCGVQNDDDDDNGGACIIL